VADTILDPSFPPTEADQSSALSLARTLAPPQTADSTTLAQLPPEQNQTGLATHLRLGPAVVTLSQLAGMIQRQTGLKLYLDPAIQDRILVVSLKDISARTALDSVARLEDWQWSQTQPGTLHLDRRRVLMPTNVADYPKCYLRALPVDLRSYFYAGASLKDAYLDSKSTLSERDFDEFKVYQARGSRIRRLLQRMTGFLSTILPDIVRQGGHLPYNKLTPAQQHALQLILVAQGFDESSLEAIRKGVDPFQRDPRSSMIRLAGGNGLMVGYDWDENGTHYGTGFGAALDPTKPVVDHSP
ncbi:MAG TPA: hypothetical protein VKT32_10510, partial [Chthonomonadaceae bacterium]|nr:hypothetical protein [Chthonomonadaceae bacterium]